MTTATKTALVIPSNRPALLAEFLKSWAAVKDWDKTIIVFDGPEAPLIEGAGDCDVYDWSDIDNGLKDDSWIVSPRTPGSASSDTSRRPSTAPRLLRRSTMTVGRSLVKRG